VEFTHRLAAIEDLAALTRLMDRAIDQLQRQFLSPDQVTASRAVMGIDTQLIADQTYFVVESGELIAGCGGWSRRATLYGGDHSADLREPRLLDPKTEPARIRAMYTDPDFTRLGVGRMILELCEQAAAADGFRSVQLMATLAGEPLYRAAGYRVVGEKVDQVGGVTVPLRLMAKSLT
jgi:GNAT superfamily N-acetyltransferase